MKVYCYFLKSNENELYAFTINEEYKQIFEEQRNMNLFIKGIKKFNTDEFKEFSYQNSVKKIGKDVLDSEGKIIEIYSTTEESDLLSNTIEYITDFLLGLKFHITNDGNEYFRLNEKYLNFILEITELLISNNDDNSILNINTFKLFTYLFKNTFFDNYEETDDELIEKVNKRMKGI